MARASRPPPSPHTPKIFARTKNAISHHPIAILSSDGISNDQRGVAHVCKSSVDDRICRVIGDRRTTGIEEARTTRTKFERFGKAYILLATSMWQLLRTLSIFQRYTYIGYEKCVKTSRYVVAEYRVPVTRYLEAGAASESWFAANVIKQP